MKRLNKPMLAACSVLALSACGDRGPLSSWNQEAGVFLDTGSFGNATLNNHQYHSGERSFVQDLQGRFQNEVQNTVNFDFNSAHLDADAKAVLRVQAHWIKQFPEIRFNVYGHADAVGGNQYNKRIGKRRADAVVHYLVSQGISKSRLNSVVSFGEEQLLIATEDRQRMNRRAVTAVSGFVGRREDRLDGEFAEILYREYVESATEQPPDTQGGLNAISGQAGG